MKITAKKVKEFKNAFATIAYVQQECVAIIKANEVKSSNRTLYNYANLDSLLSLVNPVLINVNACMSFETVLEDGLQYIALNLGSLETGEILKSSRMLIPNNTPTNKLLSPLQHLAGELTSLKRMLIMSFFSLPLANNEDKKELEAKRSGYDKEQYTTTAIADKVKKELTALKTRKELVNYWSKLSVSIKEVVGVEESFSKRAEELKEVKPSVDMSKYIEMINSATSVEDLKSNILPSMPAEAKKEFNGLLLTTINNKIKSW